MSQLEEIEGIFQGEAYRWGETLVGNLELANTSTIPGVDKHISIIGDASPDELKFHQHYRLYGKFTTYTNKRTGRTEKQFRFQTFVLAIAHDRRGVVNYLVAAGKGRGLGSATAEAAWKQFGSDAIRLIREDPGLLVDLNPRMSTENAETIAGRLRQQQKTEDATIELTGLLAGRGLPRTTARNAIKRWGNIAAQVIRRDPYKLMGFHGCGFKRADALWLEFGHGPARLKRQLMCAWNECDSNSDGHTWFPYDQIAQSIRQNIGSAKANPVKAITCGLRLARWSPHHRGALARIRTDVDGELIEKGGKLWITDASKALDERLLSELISEAIDEAEPQSLTKYESIELVDVQRITHTQCRRCGRRLTAPMVHVMDGVPFGPTCIGKVSGGESAEVIPLAKWLDGAKIETRRRINVPRGQVRLPHYSLWPDVDSVRNITDHQREKLGDALVSRVSILGGSPGVGKSHLVAQLVKAMLQAGQVGPDYIAIGCPTGKAAVRLTEIMHAHGVPLRARTWHSLLGFSDSGFLHGKSNPWPYRILIGDESSMIDTALMRAIFSARSRGCHVLMVGDVNQLPPVGAGAPFRDIIASGVCGYGELRNIMRNSGGIVEACAAIRDDQPWECGDNLRLIDAGRPEKQIESLIDLLRSFPAEIDPVWDAQVLVAVNERSELSRKSINQQLQDVLNPNPEVKGTPFRLDDKIVCLKNGRYTAIESDDEALDEHDGREVYVANGELAKVVEIEPKSITATLTSPYRMIRIPRGKQDDGGSGCNWDMAYGLSCHKSQGSEWPIIIVMLDEYRGASMICDRAWLYTAISRAKDSCYMIGRKPTADAMCRRNKMHFRKAFLKELIQKEHWQNVLGDM